MSPAERFKFVVHAPPLSLRRKLLYATLISGILVVVFFAGLELALRLAGYGYSPHFARRGTSVDGEKIWRENRWCTAPFFSPALVRRPLPFRLPEKKAPGTYRIFVLGSSAAMGDPEPSFSFARALETMLRAAYPQQRFEIVNAAITATNSHVLRGIAEDCAQLEPDLFILYEGHNEVIGPFGPAAVFAPFLRSESATRTAVWLKETHTGQMLAAAARQTKHEGALPEKWGGMQMFLQQQIAADDPRLDAVRGHFRENLRASIDAARSHGASTLLCTVVTNQRDFAPFLSQHRPNLTAAELAAWQDHFAAAEQAARAKDFSAAETEYRAALAIDDRHAELVFRLGRLALQSGRDAEARRLLQRALDLDTLRFRTDSALNQTIRDLAAGEATAGVTTDRPLKNFRPAVELVDLAQSIGARAEHGIPGDDFLYEHVHLTLRGAYEIARDLFPHVAADFARRGLASIEKIREPLSYDEVRRRLANTTHEQAMIAIELTARFGAPPFSTQSDHAFRLHRWEQRRAQAMALLARDDALPALRQLYRNAIQATPDDWILQRNAGMMFIARGAPAEALPLLQHAVAWIDDDVDTLIALGATYRALGQKAEAETAFAKARSLEPRHPALPPVTP